jgi:phosphoribosylformimino-5-aminoimidazole carboxamide ribotide isomerase
MGRMRVIPVIDLFQGQVVRGVGGRREEYRPLVSSLVSSADPGTVAAALRERFGLEQIYMADLDAITRGAPDAESWLAVAEAGVSLLLDAGIATADNAVRVWEVLDGRIGNSDFVIGLESLSSVAELAEMRNRGLPLNRACLSLDMRSGIPLTLNPRWRAAAPAEIVEEAAAYGVLQYILLDLADVGTGQGTSTLPLLRELCAQFPELSFIAGGGVRGRNDLQALHAAGASGALVASALHDGRLTATDCRAFEN